VRQTLRGTLSAATLLVACCILAPPRSAATGQLTGQERAESAGQGLVGSRAPGLILKTIDNQEIDLGRLYGKKAVYLKFWATWCVPCREQMPHFEHTYENAGPDLAVIAINIGFNDSLEDVRNFRRKLGITMPIVIDDGRLGKAFNLRVTPQHVIIGRSGRIEYVGHLADQRLDAALLAARTSEPAQSQLSEAGAAKDLPRYGVGDLLPDLSAKTVDGDTFRTREPHSSRPTVLVFMSPWCESYLATSRPGLAASCRQVREQIDTLYKGDTGYRWLAVASGLWATTDDLRDYRARYKTPVPLTIDDSGVWFRSFRVMNVPTLVICNAGGRIVRRVEGFDPSLPAQLQRVAVSR
jgi:thiol-disulfide isomerase/thioredoxin